MLGNPGFKPTGGSWLYAAYESSVDCHDVELHIITSANVKETMSSRHGYHTFHIIPGGDALHFDFKDQSLLKNITNLNHQINADVMVIWGCESKLAYAAMRSFPAIPKVIFVQGAMTNIAAHYHDGIPPLKRISTFRDILNTITRNSQYNLFKAQAKREQEMLCMADAILGENDWVYNSSICHNPSLKFYHYYLPIRRQYFEIQRKEENIEPFSIFTNAGGYPIKGHHILVQALAYVKKVYPDFKCYIPGSTLSTYSNPKRRTAYIKLIEDTIRDHKMENNIIYTGPLSIDQMASYLEKCNIYVMPSMMENQSSSLIEAMIAGAPCIAASVGGVASLVKHDINGWIYNSTDPEELAGAIIRLFRDPQKARSLGEKARLIAKLRNTDSGAKLIEICRDIVASGASHHSQSS